MQENDYGPNNTEAHENENRISDTTTCDCSPHEVCHSCAVDTLQHPPTGLTSRGFAAELFDDITAEPASAHPVTARYTEDGDIATLEVEITVIRERELSAGAGPHTVVTVGYALDGGEIAYPADLSAEHAEQIELRELAAISVANDLVTELDAITQVVALPGVAQAIYEADLCRDDSSQKTDDECHQPVGEGVKGP